MNITAVGIDLAKNVFQVHAVEARGEVVLRKQLRRAQMVGFFANMPPGGVRSSASGTQCV